MGYDMYVVDVDGRVVSETDDELYLGLNIAGGTRLAQHLVDLEMGYWHAGERQSRPDLCRSPAGVEFVDDGTYDGRWVGIGAAEWLAADQAHLRATWDERPGISVYKLCDSNDGWWVTESECESALKLWERAGHPRLDQRLGDVILFLRAAARHDGFRVW